MSNFTIQLKLKTQLYQEHILDKRFEIARNIYNSLVNIEKKKLTQLEANKDYIDLCNKIKLDIKNKTLKTKRCKIIKEYKLTQYDFEADNKPSRGFFKRNIDSNAGQKIADRVWKSFEKYLYGKGEEIHYKKFGSINTIEGKSNNTGIRFIDNKLVWNGLEIPVIIDKKDYYIQEALENEISFCRVKREIFNNKTHYYLQVILKGTPPIKYNRDTGEIKRIIGKGKVGIDIGTSTVAVVGNKECILTELAKEVQPKHNELRRLQRKLDRSRRATNPNNFNENGTIKKGIKLKWNKSNHYIKIQNEIKTLYHKERMIRRESHNKLTNKIMQYGDEFYVEQMNFQGLAKRSSKTEKNEKGKYKRKKRFGKSIANRSPAMFLTILNNKLNYFDKELKEVNTREIRASQYNHIEDNYKKKTLRQRWNIFDEKTKIQRDLYSAYLIKNVNEDLRTLNKECIVKDFNKFKEQHDKVINTLRFDNEKHLSSMAV